MEKICDIVFGPFINQYLIHKRAGVQVNLCQKHIFLDQLTHNMTNNCSLIYQFSTWKLQAKNMGRTYCVQKLFWMSKQKTICVHIMFSSCSELVAFMYWAGKSLDNLLSYCGLVDVRINASDKDLSALYVPFQRRLYFTSHQFSSNFRLKFTFPSLSFDRWTYKLVGQFQL